MPLISIIIPVYNAEHYIVRCLHSVLAQDFPHFEIVLIDDGSTDSSGKICDKCATRHDNIRVLHIPNGGASLARKEGIEIAQGEYLTFVDSDDYVAPNYVSSMYSLISKFGTKISACGVKRVKGDEDEMLRCEDENINRLLTFEELMPRFFKYEFWGFGGGLYHRSVFEGLTFPKATLAEDYYAKTQLFCRERQMAVTNAPLYFYEYHHPTSLSHTKLSERVFEEFDNVKAAYEYAREQCPQYADYALSNVVETAVKLFNLGTETGINQYSAKYDEIHTFLKENKKKIWSLRILNRHVQFKASGIIFSPSFMRFVCRLF